MIPSPDWFIGIDRLDLCDGTGNWIVNRKMDLHPMDAGTDRGLTFTSPNWAESSPRPIFRITSKFPNHPASSFNYPGVSKLPPIARVTVRQIDPNWEDDDIAADKIVADTMTATTTTRKTKTAVDLEHEEPRMVAVQLAEPEEKALNSDVMEMKPVVTTKTSMTAATTTTTAKSDIRKKSSSRRNLKNGSSKRKESADGKKDKKSAPEGLYR